MSRKNFVLNLFLVLFFLLSFFSLPAGRILALSGPVNYGHDPTKAIAHLPKANSDLSEEPGFFIISLTPRVIKSQYPELASWRELLKTQIGKLIKSRDLIGFFDPLRLENGDLVDIAATLQVPAEDVQLYELVPVIVEGLDDSMTELGCKMQFPTPYREGQPLLLVLGFAPSEDPNASLEWLALPAIGRVGDPDAQVTDWVEFVLTPDLAKDISRTPCLLGVLSGPVGD